MKKSNIAFITLVIAAGTFFAWAAFTPHHPEGAAANQSAFAAQTNADGGVNISVQPIDLQSKEWIFSVALNTHSESLPDDIASSATLTDGPSDMIVPLRWEAEPPSSMPEHHRTGTLVFPAPASMPQSITLIIANIGGVATRTFSWNLP